MGHRLSKSSWSSSNKNQNSSKTSSKKNAGNSLSTTATATTTINSISHTPTIDLITTTNSQNLQIQSATLTVPNQVVPQSFIIRIQLSKMEPETTTTATTTAGMASGSGIDEQQRNLEAAIAAITTQFENQNFIQTSLDNNLNIDSKQPIINLTFTKNIICDPSNSSNNTVDCIQNDSHQSGAINSDNEIKLSNLVPSSSSATASNSIAAMSNRTIDHNLNANFINDFNNILQRDSNGRQEINWSINCNNNNHSLMTTVTNLNTNSNNNCNNNNNNANFNINITNNNLNSDGIENSQISNIINSTSGGTTVCNISTSNLPSNLTTTLNINNRTFNNNNNNNFIATASSNSNSNNSQALMRLNSSSCIEYNDVPDSTPVLNFLAPAVICAEDGKPHRVCHCKRNRSPAYPSKWRCCVCFETLKNLNVAKANKKHWMAKLKCKRPDSTTKEKTPEEDSKSDSTSTSRSSLDSSSQSSGIEAYPPGHVVTPPCIQNHFIQTMTRCNNGTGTPNVIVVSVNHPKPSCCAGAMEDCDDRARRLRALEIAQGVDPPPGFIPQQQQILAPIDTVQLSPNATPAFPQQGLSPELLGSAIAAIGVPNTWHMLCSQGSGATNMANVSCFGTIVHSQVDYIHCLVPDLEKITSSAFYWGKMDRYEAERLLEGKPEGTFLLRDSAQEEYLFSVTFRKYGRSLHARIEQYNHKFSFDCHDPGVFTAPTVTGLLEHYKDPSCVMFFEPMLTIPLNRNFTFSLQQLCRATIVSNIKYDGINELHLPNSLKSYLKEYHYKLRVRVKPFDEHFYNGS